jgi:chemotaxis protein methyltransferase CheR
MHPALLPASLQPIRDLIRSQLGLHFPPDRTDDLVRGLEAAAHALGFPDCSSLLEANLPPSRLLENLQDYLTVGETYFFRDPAAFDALEREILPSLIREREKTTRHLRIWSAGCASGEEAFSIAIVVRRLLPESEKWTVEILGTDLNRHQLDKARAGIFRPWSFRCVPPHLLHTYFQHVGDHHLALAPDILKMVRFEQHNLLASSPPMIATGIDIVFCRNVLIYFAAEAIPVVLRHLAQPLREGGWLILGASDPGQECNLTRVHWPGANLYRKTPEVSSPPGPPILSSPSPRPSARDDVARARTLANYGRLDEALESCDRAIVKDRLNPALHYLKANIQQERGSWHDAQTSLERAVFLDPDFLAAHFSLGLLAQRLGNRTLASEHFQNATRLIDRYDANVEIPETGGITSARLGAIIASMQSRNT